MNNQPLTPKPLATAPGECVEAGDDTMRVELKRFGTRPNGAEFVNVSIHVDPDSRDGAFRAYNLGDDRMAVGTLNASMFVTTGQALDLVGSILGELPADVTEAFVRTLVQAFVDPSVYPPAP